MIILGTNSIKDTGYDVDNSVRLNDGSSDGFSLSGQNGNRKTMTFSFWVKRGVFGENCLFYSRIDASNHFLIRFTGAHQLELLNRTSASNNFILTTNRLFRDVSAWYHIVVAVDTTQGTSGNRIKFYVNGVQETSFATQTIGSQNADLSLNTSSTTHYVGQEYTSGSNFFDGYMAETVLIDGQQLAPDQFGEFDEDSGIWKPIDVSGLTFGTNGFYLDFEDSSALGNDVSGNDNDFTVNNLTAIDQSTDTCTNNFATLNPLEAEDNSPTYSDGNLTQTTPTTGGSGGRSSIEIPHTGVWYWEVKIVSVTGTVGDNIRLGISTDSPSSNDGQSIKYMSNGQSVIPGSASSYGATYTAGDIIGIKVDADNNQVTFYKNGASQGAISYTMVAGETYKAVVGEFSNTIGCVYSINFGNPPFTISSGNSDPSGYGNFEYSTDSGYALNTKNLAEYG